MTLSQGKRCSNHECGFRLHEICEQRFFRSNGQRRCPRCRSEWTGSEFVGEKAARGQNTGRRSAGSRPSQAPSRISGSNVHEDNDSE
ncbi:MAG: hypothetical protein INR71_10895 [Terriglobus roseus]|nr:hypothetical protein [Terriglobus roseus]